MTRLLHLTTVPQTLFFLRGQPDFLRAHGFEIHAVSSPGEDLNRFGVEEHVITHGIPMRRAISPFADLVGVIRLWRLFRKIHPNIVHAHTPKGGLLGMIAATLAFVPSRIYHIHGLPLVTSRGVKRWLLVASDRLACSLAHQVFCVSHSVRALAISEGLVKPSRIAVLCNGSINGVDAEGRFRRSTEVVEGATAARERWNIPVGAPVVGFVGRLVRDKGVSELAHAWRELREEFPEAHLLVVGGQEIHDPLAPNVLLALQNDPRVHLVGHQRETPPLYAAMSVLALPTYREGFVVTALEAAAMELPVVGTDVPGCRDAVADGETGTLVPARDAPALARALARYLRDPGVMTRHGQQGRRRAIRDYRPQLLWKALRDVYLDDGSAPFRVVANAD